MSNAFSARVALAALALASVASTQAPPAAPAAPTAREQDDLVKAYCAADGRARAGIDEQLKVSERLATVPALTESQSKGWRKKIEKLWSDGRELEKKSGQKHLWEKPDRGLFIVGGEVKKPKALVICMHGGGKGEGDAWSAQGAYNSALDDLGWLAIYPEVLEKTEHGWTDSGSEEFVMELVDEALRTWKIDRNHVYFVGHSMGGYGSWTLGAHHADTVAGLAPSAGAPTPTLGSDGQPNDIADGVIPNLRNVRIAIYQSDDDPNVPPAANRVAVKKLAEAKERWGGYDYEYWEVPHRQHDLPPGGPEALLEKISSAVRNPHPPKVVWQPALTWKRQFYWLWWDRPARDGIVVAEADREKNEIRVQCNVNPRGLGVFLDPKLLDPEREVGVFLNDKQVFRGKVTRTLAALVQSGVRGDPELAFDMLVPLAP